MAISPEISEGERGKLGFNVIQEICEYLAYGSRLVHVTETFLCFFKFGSSTWGPQVRLSTQIQADMWSRWVLLEGEGAFSCGGKCYAGREKATAFILARNGAAERRPI